LTGIDAKAAYQQKLGASLTPLVSTNGHLSTSLLALSGRGTDAASLATSQAQTADYGTRRCGHPDRPGPMVTSRRMLS